MSGLPEHNIPAFIAAAARLRQMGLVVLNPAELPHTTMPGATWEDCIRADVEALMRCGAVAVLPGWQRSRGATLEVYLARQIGLPILDAQTLEPWGVQPADWRGRVVGLWGAATVGKDTIQKHLGMPRAAFADALKEDLAPVFKQLGLDVGNPDHKKIGRNLLVEYGRLGRIVDADYWIKRLFLPPSAAVITDVRYINEMKWIWAKGGIVFEIIRPGVGPANAEEARSFAEIRDYAKANGIAIPQIHNDVEGQPEIAAVEVAHRVAAHFGQAACAA